VNYFSKIEKLIKMNQNAYLVKEVNFGLSWKISFTAKGLKVKSV